MRSRLPFNRYRSALTSLPQCHHTITALPSNHYRTALQPFPPPFQSFPPNIKPFPSPLQ
ncbi:MAG: hypothetical protein ABIT08_13015 [Bacteroidia bacterium]